MTASDGGRKTDQNGGEDGQSPQPGDGMAMNLPGGAGLIDGAGRERQTTRHGSEDEGGEEGQRGGQQESHNEENLAGKGKIRQSLVASSW